MEGLTKLLKEHDKFYEYSDDMNAYSRGKAQKEAIITLVMRLEGLDRRAALKRFEELNNG